MSARNKKTNDPPPRTTLIRPRDKFRKELGQRLEIGEEFYKREIRKVDQLEQLQTEFHTWDDYNSELLKASFNKPSNEYKYEYDHCDQMLGLMDYAQGRYNPNDPAYKLKDTKRNIEAKLDNLRNLLEKVDLIPSNQDENNDEPDGDELPVGRNVFIIHGHDEERLTELKEILQDDFKLTPFILQKLPNIGSPTIIEKFEFYAKQCSFAVALFTPDDVIEKDGEQYLQARPNVIYELGWFSARLSRKNVMLLLKDGTNIFSDFQGILQLRFNDKVSEKYREIMFELKAIGLIK